jgi:hypothetical protein
MTKKHKPIRKLSEVRERKLQKEAANEPDLLKQTTGISHFINISYSYIRPKGFKAHLVFFIRLPKAFLAYKAVHSRGNL